VCLTDERPPRVRTVARLSVSADETIVTGVTSLGDRIYVLCHRSNVIAVFTSHQPFRRLQDIVVHGLLFPDSIAASASTSCLYVPDLLSRSVWRVNVDSGAVVQWLSGVPAMAVSVTSGDRIVLLVVVDVQRDHHGRRTWRGEVHVCSPEAVTEAIVTLSPDITSPRSVVMTTRKTFVVSHGLEEHEMHRVCEVDMTGRVLKSFGSTPGYGVEQLHRPVRVSLDDKERVIVADFVNHRVLLLNIQLTSPSVLATWRPQSDDDTRGPVSLHYDSHTGSLLVGLKRGHIDIYKLN